MAIYDEISARGKPSAPHYYLGVIGVHPDLHGRGVGTQLLKALCDLSVVAEPRVVVRTIHCGRHSTGGHIKIARQDIPTRINLPGAVARQLPNFGDATGYGKIGAEYFSLATGTDISPFLQGLQTPLGWGTLLLATRAHGQGEPGC
jgi:GNAT superfamily N-acetyltransferase